MFELIGEYRTWLLIVVGVLGLIGVWMITVVNWASFGEDGFWQRPVVVNPCMALGLVAFTLGGFGSMWSASQHNAETEAQVAADYAELGLVVDEVMDLEGSWISVNVVSPNGCIYGLDAEGNSRDGYHPEDWEGHLLLAVENRGRECPDKYSFRRQSS